MDFSKYPLQEILFAERPSRLSLQQLIQAPTAAREITVNVWRNHSIEPIISLARAYQDYGCYAVDYRLGDYDDSLSFSGHDRADIELLWIDSSRYVKSSTPDTWRKWLVSRIHGLRNISVSPILVATWTFRVEDTVQLKSELESIPGVFFADLQAVSNDTGTALTDSRTAALAGTPLSNTIQPQVARKLACHWIPAAIFPRIKAVAIDLDNTLHAGILGEDGIGGVQLTPGHHSLQKFMKSLQSKGIFIALVSRNELADVEKLFSQREDFPLRWADFTTVQVSWGDKAEALANIANSLRISADAILFVDDNPGELAGVVRRLPEIHTVYASSDATLTQRAIEYYPGLWRWRIEYDDAKRVQDLKANAEREAILSHVGNGSDYFRSLQTKLIFQYDSLEQIGRLAELCGKTNQFNLTLQRFNQAELAARMASPDASVVSVQMQDRLSDSGVIAVIVAERKGHLLVIEELCVSCRAMGRQLEDTLIFEAVRGMPVFEGCADVCISPKLGPRNQPALKWLSQCAVVNKTGEGEVHTISAEKLNSFVPPDGILLIKN
jgi:FkbH-like protein